MLIQNVWTSLIVLSMCAMLGCDLGLPTASPVGEVSGIVSLDGKPVVGAKVIFVPARLFNDFNMEEPISIGTTDQEGKFQLKTIEGAEGAVAGQHVVLIKKSADESTDAADKANSDDDADKNAVESVMGESESELPFSSDARMETIPPLYNRHSILSFNVLANKQNQAKFELSTVDPLLKQSK